MISKFESKVNSIYEGLDGVKKTAEAKKLVEALYPKFIEIQNNRIVPLIQSLIPEMVEAYKKVYSLNSDKVVLSNLQRMLRINGPWRERDAEAAEKLIELRKNPEVVCLEIVNNSINNYAIMYPEEGLLPWCAESLQRIRKLMSLEELDKRFTETYETIEQNGIEIIREAISEFIADCTVDVYFKSENDWNFTMANCTMIYYIIKKFKERFSETSRNISREVKTIRKDSLNIENPVEIAKKSPQYKTIMNFGFVDDSTDRQKKNLTMSLYSNELGAGYHIEIFASGNILGIENGRSLKAKLNVIDTHGPGNSMSAEDYIKAFEFIIEYVTKRFKITDVPKFLANMAVKLKI